MSNKRTTMRKLREILRLRLQAGLSIRAISRSAKLSVGGVQKLLSRAETLSLTWPLPAELDDTHSGARYEARDRAAVHEKLKRPHMTRQRVWLITSLYRTGRRSLRAGRRPCIHR